MYASKKAMYIVCYEVIYDMIRSGELKPGDRLPGEVSLSKKLNVSRSTLRQALLLLKENGIIYNRQGSGNYVAHYENQPKPGLDKLIPIPVSFAKQPLMESLLRIVYEVPSNYIAERLTLNQSSLVMNCHKTYMVDQKMVAYSLYMIPTKWLEDYNVNLNEESDILKFIDHRLINIAVKSEAHVVYTQSGEFLQDLFKIKINERIILIDEVYQTETGQAICAIRHSMLPDYFDFFITRNTM